MTKITAEELRELLIYDLLTGLFTWKNDRFRSDGFKLFCAGQVAGTTQTAGYIQIAINRRFYLAHRLAFLYVTGSWPQKHVDHRNGKRGDNRWSNLRDVSASVNLQNRQAAQSNSTTGLLGVSLNKRRGNYSARIMVDGVYRNLGYFKCPQVAHQAYLTAKRQLHVGCTI